MLKRKDQAMLSEAYSLVGGGDVSAPSLMGKPVMVTMDMPGAEVSTDSSDHQENDSSEIEMALSELHKLTEYAPKLKEIVADLPSLEGWVSSKITKASDYISSVYHWLEYQQHEGCGDHSHEMYNTGSEDSGCEYAKQGCECGGCSDCQ
jgi:hypothetical protein